MSKHNNRTDGFTIIEVALITPILLIVIASMLAVLVQMLRVNTAQNVALNLSYESQRALDIIETDVNLSSAYLTTNDTANGMSDPYKYTSNWSYKGASGNPDVDQKYRALILRTYSTTENTLSTTKQPVYINTNGCSGSNRYSNEILQYNVIYFVKDGTLYKRLITNSSSPTCEPQYQVQSCPTNVGSPRNAKCKADDEIILRNVKSFNIDYYTLPTDQSPIDAYNSNESSVLQGADSIEVTISSEQFTSAEPVSVTKKFRMSKIN